MKYSLRNIVAGRGLVTYQMTVISLMALALWIASLFLG